MGRKEVGVGRYCKGVELIVCLTQVLHLLAGQ